MAFAAVVGPPEHERIVATGSYYLDPRDGMAEVAYMVEPEWQRSGLATALHARTVEYARAHGVRGFTADVLVATRPCCTVFRRGHGARPPAWTSRRRRLRAADALHRRGRRCGTS